MYKALITIMTGKPANKTNIMSREGMYFGRKYLMIKENT